VRRQLPDEPRMIRLTDQDQFTIRLFPDNHFWQYSTLYLALCLPFSDEAKSGIEPSNSSSFL
jgi:hypothetical protein